MAQGAEETGGVEVFYFKDRDIMTERLLEYLKEGDTVLVKASHFMEYPQVVEAIKEKSSYISGRK